MADYQAALGRIRSAFDRGDVLDLHARLAERMGLPHRDLPEAPLHHGEPLLAE